MYSNWENVTIMCNVCQSIVYITPGQTGVCKKSEAINPCNDNNNIFTNTGTFDLKVVHLAVKYVTLGNFSCNQLASMRYHENKITNKGVIFFKRILRPSLPFDQRGGTYDIFRRDHLLQFLPDT